MVRRWRRFIASDSLEFTSSNPSTTAMVFWGFTSLMRSLKKAQLPQELLVSFYKCTIEVYHDILHYSMVLWQHIWEQQGPSVHHQNGPEDHWLPASNTGRNLQNPLQLQSHEHLQRSDHLATASPCMPVFVYFTPSPPIKCNNLIIYAPSRAPLFLLYLS